MEDPTIYIYADDESFTCPHCGKGINTKPPGGVIYPEPAQRNRGPWCPHCRSELSICRSGLNRKDADSDVAGFS